MTTADLTHWIREHVDVYAGTNTALHPVTWPATVRGASLGLDDQAIRTALRTCQIPLPTRRQFTRIASAARAHVDSRSHSGSPAARAAARLQVARRLIGRVLAPAPTIDVWVEDGGDFVQASKPAVSARRQVQARRAFALIGLEALRDADRGWEGVTVSVQRLAVQLGVTETTARAIVKLLRDELRWLRPVKRLGGGAWVYKLARLDATAGAAADAYAVAVDALADGVPDTDPVAAVVSTAREAGWGWLASAPASAWLVAVLDAAGLRGQAAASRGGPRRPGATRAWLADVRAHGHGDLATGLAALAEVEHVHDRVKARLTALQAEQDADRQRRAALAERRTWRRKARRLIQRVAPTAGALAATTDERGRAAWARTIRAGLVGVDLEPRMREAVASIVSADLATAGDVHADAGGRWVAGLSKVG